MAALQTGTIVPVNEGQARALAGLDSGEAAKVLQIAAEISDGHMTATKIREARGIREETLGVSQKTVSNYDEPRQEHPARSSHLTTSAAERKERDPKYLGQAADEGMSSRAIAPIVGVSDRQVRKGP